VKIIVIILIAVMMLAGGTFGVMKWMGLGPFAPDDAEMAEEPTVLEEPPVFIDLAPLLINIFQGDSVLTTVQISVKIKALGPDNSALVREGLPKITDTFLRDLHSFLPRIMKNSDSRLDLFVIKKRLKLIADKIFPDNRINDVLIQSVSEGS
jgi:flagellar basal body-associated protein FliL